MTGDDKNVHREEILKWKTLCDEMAVILKMIQSPSMKPHKHAIQALIKQQLIEYREALKGDS